MPNFHQCSLSHDGSLRTGVEQRRRGSGVWETNPGEAVGWFAGGWWEVSSGRSWLRAAQSPSVDHARALVTNVLDGGGRPIGCVSCSPLDEQREGGT